MNEWDREKRIMEKIYYNLTMDKIETKDVQNENELGYTGDAPYIFLSYHNCIVNKLEQTILKKMFRLGVFLHETGHKIFSDFEMLKTNNYKFDAFEREIFNEISNIMEDPAIEWLMQHILTPFLKKCLLYHIGVIYEKSEPIQIHKSEYAQFISALIQTGDRGAVKGVFTYPLAEEIYTKALPYLNKCSRCKEVEIRFQCMHEVFLLSKPLWEKEKENSMEFLKKINDLLNQENIQIESNGNLGIPMPFINEVNEEDIEGGGGSNMEVILSGMLSEASLNSLSCELEMEEMLIKAEEKYLDEKPVVESPFFQDVKVEDHYAVIKNSDIAEYNRLIYEYAGEISDFTNTLQRIYKKNSSKKKKSMDGKLSEERYLRKNSVRIFDRHRREKEKNEMAIVIAIDVSGSMSGRKEKEAKKMAIIVAEAAAMAGVKLYVFGFHESTPVILEHFVTWNNTEEERPALADNIASGGNFDGYAVRYAGELLRNRKEKQKLLFVLHDGEPTGLYQSVKEGILDVADAVSEIKQYADVFGIAVMCRNQKAFYKMYGETYVYIDDARQISDILCRKIIELLGGR